jgi:hypothetical protein
MIKDLNNDCKLGIVINCSCDHISFEGFPIKVGTKFIIQNDWSPAKMTKVQSTLSGQELLFTDYDLSAFFDVVNTVSLPNPIFLQPGYAFTNANYGSLTKRQGYTSLGEVAIVEPKTIHSTCRSCGTKGSHNVVNHKEYYWCKSCRDEC